jgi:hypothetical protein
MTRDEFEVFEDELQKLKPKPPPEDFMQRLALTVPKPPQQAHAAARVTQIFNLLYRRFSTCRRRNSTERPADYKPAIEQTPGRSLPLRPGWILRALGAGAVAVVVAMLFWLRPAAEIGKTTPQPRVTQAKTALKADNVEIDRQLLTSFDAVARLPGGEPVRFRCREWMDQLVVRDSSRGVVIEQRAPHLEIVPVGFETY